MCNYVITKYSYDKAQQLRLVIEVSKNKYKKIDVYKENIFLASIGDIHYQDYPHYILMYNLEYVNKRRELYINRHKMNSDVKCSRHLLRLFFITIFNSIITNNYVGDSIVKYIIFKFTKFIICFCTISF